MQIRQSLLKSGVVLAVLSAPGISLLAQMNSQPSQPTVIQQDGGTRETLESIFVPPIMHAPFSLVLATEWSRPLGGGGSFTSENRRRIMRDGQGRIYEERWLLVPKGGHVDSHMNYIQVADPTKHTLYNCRVEAKTCFLLRYGGSTEAKYEPDHGASGPLEDGSGFRAHEDLGVDHILGIDTVGVRETTTIHPGVYGNDQPMVSKREFWYSPQLGINLVSSLESPVSGKQTFTVVDLSTSEPEPDFFTVPPGYKVVDQRKVEPAQF